MREIPVLISITSSAHREDAAEDESISLITSGTMALTEDGAVIRYEETLDETMPPQPVTVTLNGDAATMSRSGDYATDMVFRMGSRYEGLYHTPYGDMELALYCTRLSYELDEEGGEIVLSYQLDLNGQFAAMHDMELHLAQKSDD